MFEKNELMDINKRNPDAGLRKPVSTRRGASEILSSGGDPKEAEDFINKNKNKKEFLVPENIPGSDDEDAIIEMVDRSLAGGDINEGDNYYTQEELAKYEERAQKKYYNEQYKIEKMRSSLESALNPDDAKSEIKDDLAADDKKIARKDTDYNRSNENLKTLSEQKLQRKNRGVIGRFLDKYF